MSGVDLTAILAFLRARLDEEEREATWAAEEAGGAAWTTHSIDVVLFDDTDRYVSGNAQNEVRDHIARHDPARVLAEVAAKRRIVEVVLSWRHRVVEDCWYTCPAATKERDGGETCYDDSDGTCNCGLDQRRLAVLTPFAAPFAQHPDFDPAWRINADH